MAGRGGCSGLLCGQRCDGRMRLQRVLAEAHSLWARKGSADEGPAGPLAYLIQNLQLVLKRHSY